MPQPAAVREIDAELQRIFRDAWDEVEAQQRLILERPEQYRRLARLREVQRNLEAMMDQVDGNVRWWIENRMPLIYGMGANAADDSFTWTQVHMGALRTLAVDMMDDVLKATRFVRRDVKRFIRTVSRERLLAKLAIGQTAIGTGREIEKLIRERGISAIRYADGSRHGLREYGEMLARTKSAQAYNSGTLTQGQENGIRFYEILDGPDCGLSFHNDTTIANGLIVDRDTADKYIISHPNCRRSFAARPDLTTKREAKSARSLVTAEQNADIRQADLVRRELRRRSRLSKRGRSRRDVARGARERRLLQRQLQTRTGGGAIDDAVRVIDDAPQAFQYTRGANEAVDRYIAERLPTYSKANLARDQVENLQHYSGSGFVQVNGRLRRGMELSGADDAARATLDDLISRSQLSESMTVFRGATADFVGELRVGDVLTDNAFVSTSARHDVAAKFTRESGNPVMEIHLKPGQNALANPMSTRESEIILPRGSQFRVVGTVDRPGSTVKHIVLEAL